MSGRLHPRGLREDPGSKQTVEEALLGTAPLRGYLGKMSLNLPSTTPPCPFLLTCMRCAYGLERDSEHPESLLNSRRLEFSRQIGHVVFSLESFNQMMPLLKCH